MDYIMVDGEQVPVPPGTPDSALPGIAAQHRASKAQPPAQTTPGGDRPAPGFSFGQMARNVPGSAAQFAKDITTPIRHPIQTVTGLGNLILGTLQLAVPGEQGKEQVARQVGEFYVQRYGSPEAALKALQEDPVGVASDVSGLLTGGTMALPKALGGASKVARGVGRVGAALDPTNVVTQPGRVLVRSAARGPLAPEALMESSMKFGTTMPASQRSQLTRTMLDEGLLPNPRGVEQAGSLIEELGNKVNTLVDRATLRGTTVPVSTLETFIPELRQKFGRPTIESARDLERLDRIMGEYRAMLQDRGISELTPRQLQDIKQDIYLRVDWNPTKRMKPAKEETYKAVARGAREGLEQVAPEVRDLNRRQGDLLELAPHLNRSANRISNRDVLGIGGPVKTAGGGAIDAALGLPGVATAAGFASGIMDAPVMKARLARSLDRLQKGPMFKASKPGALTRALAAESGRLTQELYGD